MRIRIVFSLCFFFTIFACEKDDICIESTTSKLVIKLYDKSSEDTPKSANGVYVWLVANDTLEAYKNVAIDSIAVSLDPNMDVSSYVIQQNSMNDTITFNYSRNDVFVSRSCGYRVNYEMLNIQNNTNNWIDHITVENQTVENEKAAHIHIYH